MAQITVTEDVRGQKLPFPLQIHENVKPNLDTIWKYIIHKWDGLIIIFGKSGVGKSHLAKTFALYFDATFSNKKVFFNPKEFSKWVDKTPKRSVCILDEADFTTDRSQKHVMYIIKAKMKRIREKNLLIIFCTPTIKDMDWYFVDRAIMGVRCKAYAYNDRGHYDCYVNTDSDGRFEMLLELMKRSATQRSSYMKIAPSIRNCYNRHPQNYIKDWESVWHIDEQELSKRKAKDTEQMGKERKDKSTIEKELKQKIMKNLLKINKENLSNMTNKYIGNVLGVTPTRISHYYEELGGKSKLHQLL